MILIRVIDKAGHETLINPYLIKRVFSTCGGIGIEYINGNRELIDGNYDKFLKQIVANYIIYLKEKPA